MRLALIALGMLVSTAILGSSHETVDQLSNEYSYAYNEKDNAVSKKVPDKVKAHILSFPYQTATRSLPQMGQFKKGIHHRRQSWKKHILDNITPNNIFNPLNIFSKILDPLKSVSPNHRVVKKIEDRGAENLETDRGNTGIINANSILRLITNIVSKLIGLPKVVPEQTTNIDGQRNQNVPSKQNIFDGREKEIENLIDQNSNYEPHTKIDDKTTHKNIISFIMTNLKSANGKYIFDSSNLTLVRDSSKFNYSVPQELDVLVNHLTEEITKNLNKKGNTRRKIKRRPFMKGSKMYKYNSTEIKRDEIETDNIPIKYETKVPVGKRTESKDYENQNNYTSMEDSIPDSNQKPKKPKQISKKYPKNKVNGKGNKELNLTHGTNLDNVAKNKTKPKQPKATPRPESRPKSVDGKRNEASQSDKKALCFNEDN